MTRDFIIFKILSIFLNFFYKSVKIKTYCQFFLGGGWEVSYSFWCYSLILDWLLALFFLLFWKKIKFPTYCCSYDISRSPERKIYFKKCKYQLAFKRELYMWHVGFWIREIWMLILIQVIFSLTQQF